VRPKPKRRLAVQVDELWSFVGNKGNKQWVWLALDAQTRELVGVHIANLRAGSVQAGVAVDAPGLPPMCRSRSAIGRQPMRRSYPANGLPAVGKETGKTSYERFNCTLPQGVSRLVRKSLSFSKKLENHKASNLVIHPPLQCFAFCLLILSCLGLPILESR
jgi:insertion element IS1 protein InsB